MNYFAPYKFCFLSNSLTKIHLIRSLISIISLRSKVKTQKFIELLSHYFNVKTNQIYLFGAGRMGVYSLFKSLKLVPEDEIIVAGYTCVVLTNVVKFVDCKIRYVDISSQNLNIDTEQLIKNIGAHTKAIIVPHNFGILYEDIDLIKKQFPHVLIIEDAAHAFGSKFNDGQLAGLKGDAAFFSMEYSKPITTGLGGVLILNNEDLIPDFEKYYQNVPYFSTSKWLKILITFTAMNLTMVKQTQFFFFVAMVVLRKTKLIYATSDDEIRGLKPVDYPVKLSPTLASLGYYQMKDIEQINGIKKEIAEMYFHFFKQFTSMKQFYNPNYVYVRYPLVFDATTSKESIEKIKIEASELGMSFGDWFNDVVHPHGIFRYGYDSYQCFIGEHISKTIINLPININIRPTIAELNQIKEIFIKNGIH